MGTIEREYKLKLATGKVVTWSGTDGVNAAERYVDCHRETTVVAWKPVAHGLFIGAPQE